MAQSDLGNGKKIALAPNAEAINLRVHSNAPTTIPDLASAAKAFSTPGAQSQAAKSQTLNMDGTTVPYPFMQGFCDRKTGNRFTKRVVFDRSDYDDLLGRIVDQIHEKRDRDLFDKI